jgi:hypothetical protein
MAKFKAGTPVTNNPKRAHLTQEQWDAFEKALDPNAPVRAAKAEFVNHFLLPDGTIERNEEYHASMIAKAERDKDDAIRAAHAALDGNDPAEALRAAEAAAHATARRGEVEDHLAQSRFLFAVDEEGMPVVYFQCAVSGNPDVFPPQHGGCGWYRSELPPEERGGHDARRGHRDGDGWWRRHDAGQYQHCRGPDGNGQHLHADAVSRDWPDQLGNG